ncbi:MAG: hypothetical protein WAT58_05455 [Candidatus Dormiibacterota bacterium]
MPGSAAAGIASAVVGLAFASLALGAEGEGEPEDAFFPGLTVVPA